LYHGHSAPAAHAALAISATAVATFYLVAGLVPPGAALVAGQLAQGGVAFGAAWLLAGSPRASGLVRPPWLTLAAAVLLGASCWYLDLRVADLLPWSDAQGDDARALTEVVRQPALVTSIVTLALIPALCEELVFRGVLARGLATRLHPAAAAAIAAALFAAYHMSPLQAVPALLFGLALGALALRARSILPAIVAHALNNTFVIAVTRDDTTSAWFDDHARAALAGASILCAAGVALLVVARPT
jgi:membrane protease YdiL (CAAX protease family)